MVDRLAPAILVLAALGGIAAAYALLLFILSEQRLLPEWLLLVCSSAGLYFVRLDERGIYRIGKFQSFVAYPLLARFSAGFTCYILGALISGLPTNQWSPRGETNAPSPTLLRARGSSVASVHESSGK